MATHPPLNTLKKRSDFLRVRGGAKWSGTAFLIDCRPSLQPGPPRFGFTVTKKLGGAVVRNRMRRRLREAVRLTQAGRARDAVDYVLVARSAALERPFEDLCADMISAFARLHRTATPPSTGRGPATKR